MDINELLQEKLKEAWDKLEEDKIYYSRMVNDFKEIRDQVRDQIKGLRDQKLEETQRVVKKIIKQFKKTANQLDTISIPIGDYIIKD
ncbi:MAG: hypothetical protein ACFE8E_08435 [Candidatus Hodarchaeota archaeon]